MLLELHLLCTIYFFGENIEVLHILSKFLYCHKLKNTAIYFYFVYNFSGASWGGLLSVYRLQWWKCVRCINIFCDWIANWTMERIIKLWKRHEIFCKVLFGIICRDNYSMSLVVCFYLYIVLNYYKGKFIVTPSGERFIVIIDSNFKLIVDTAKKKDKKKNKPKNKIWIFIYSYIDPLI